MSENTPSSAESIPKKRKRHLDDVSETVHEDAAGHMSLSEVALAESKQGKKVSWPEKRSRTSQRLAARPSVSTSATTRGAAARKSTTVQIDDEDEDSEGDEDIIVSGHSDSENDDAELDAGSEGKEMTDGEDGDNEWHIDRILACKFVPMAGVDENKMLSTNSIKLTPVKSLHSSSSGDKFSDTTAAEAAALAPDATTRKTSIENGVSLLELCYLVKFLGYSYRHLRWVRRCDLLQYGERSIEAKLQNFHRKYPSSAVYGLALSPQDVGNYRLYSRIDRVIGVRRLKPDEYFPLTAGEPYATDPAKNHEDRTEQCSENISKLSTAADFLGQTANSPVESVSDSKNVSQSSQQLTDAGPRKVPKVEYLVKWELLGYSESTWEADIDLHYEADAAAIERFRQVNLSFEFPSLPPPQGVIMASSASSVSAGKCRKNSRRNSKSSALDFSVGVVQGENYKSDAVTSVEGSTRLWQMFLKRKLAADGTYIPSIKWRKSKAVTSQNPDGTPSNSIESARSLMAHQQEGLKWLFFNAEVNRHGSLLADEMGLGKTCQSITFLEHAMHVYSAGRSTGCHALVVVQKSVLENWKREFEVWAPHLHVLPLCGGREDREVAIEFEKPWCDLTTGKNIVPSSVGAKKLMKPDVVLLTYEGLRTSEFSRLVNSLNAAARKNKGNGIFKWTVVVVDECQKVKAGRGSLLLNLLANLKREFTLLLTGTPVQNTTEELFPMLTLLNPAKFYYDVQSRESNNRHNNNALSPEGSWSASRWNNKFSNIQSRDDCMDLTEELHSIIAPYILRREKANVLKTLPPKTVKLLKIPLTLIQKRVYSALYHRGIRTKGIKYSNIHMQLRKCCIHPYLIDGIEELILEGKISGDVLSNSLATLPELNASESGSLVTSPNAEPLATATESIDSSVEAMPGSNESAATSSRTVAVKKDAPSGGSQLSTSSSMVDDDALAHVKHVKLESYGAAVDSMAAPSTGNSVEAKTEGEEKAAANYSPHNDPHNESHIANSESGKVLPIPEDEDETTRARRLILESSGKFVLLKKMLEAFKAANRKVLLFSFFKTALDLVEDFLSLYEFPWVTERVDGETSGEERQLAIDRFNSDPGRFLFLCTTRAGGLGINLTSASVVIHLDSDFNPQHDIQAQARCHRIGQSRHVDVFHFIAEHTYEDFMLFNIAGKKLGLEAVLLGRLDQSRGRNNKPDKRQEEKVLRKGVFAAIRDDEAARREAQQFAELNLEEILSQKATTVLLEGDSEKDDDTSDNVSPEAHSADAAGVCGDQKSNSAILNANSETDIVAKTGLEALPENRTFSGATRFSTARFEANSGDSETAAFAVEGLNEDEPDFWSKVVERLGPWTLEEEKPKELNRADRRRGKNVTYRNEDGIGRSVNASPMFDSSEAEDNENDEEEDEDDEHRKEEDFTPATDDSGSSEDDRTDPLGREEIAALLGNCTDTLPPRRSKKRAKLGSVNTSDALAFALPGSKKGDSSLPLHQQMMVSSNSPELLKNMPSNISGLPIVPGLRLAGSIPGIVGEGGGANNLSFPLDLTGGISATAGVLGFNTANSSGGMVPGATQKSDNPVAPQQLSEMLGGQAPAARLPHGLETTGPQSISGTFLVLDLFYRCLSALRRWRGTKIGEAGGLRTDDIRDADRFSPWVTTCIVGNKPSLGPISSNGPGADRFLRQAWTDTFLEWRRAGAQWEQMRSATVDRFAKQLLQTRREMMELHWIQFLKSLTPEQQAAQQLHKKEKLLARMNQFFITEARRLALTMYADAITEALQAGCDALASEVLTGRHFSREFTVKKQTWIAAEDFSIKLVFVHLMAQRHAAQELEKKAAGASSPPVVPRPGLLPANTSQPGSTASLGTSDTSISEGSFSGGPLAAGGISTISASAAPLTSQTTNNMSPVVDADKIPLPQPARPSGTTPPLVAVLSGPLLVNASGREQPAPLLSTVPHVMRWPPPQLEINWAIVTEVVKRLNRYTGGPERRRTAVHERFYNKLDSRWNHDDFSKREREALAVALANALPPHVVAEELPTRSLERVKKGLRCPSVIREAQRGNLLIQAKMTGGNEDGPILVDIITRFREICREMGLSNIYYFENPGAGPLSGSNFHVGADPSPPVRYTPLPRNPPPALASDFIPIPKGPVSSSSSPTVTSVNAGSSTPNGAGLGKPLSGMSSLSSVTSNAANASRTPGFSTRSVAAAAPPTTNLPKVQPVRNSTTKSPGKQKNSVAPDGTNVLAGLLSGFGVTGPTNAESLTVGVLVESIRHVLLRIGVNEADLGALKHSLMQQSVSSLGNLLKELNEVQAKQCELSYSQTKPLPPPVVPPPQLGSFPKTVLPNPSFSPIVPGVSPSQNTLELTSRSETRESFNNLASTFKSLGQRFNSRRGPPNRALVPAIVWSSNAQAKNKSFAS